MELPPSVSLQAPLEESETSKMVGQPVEQSGVSVEGDSELVEAGLPLEESWVGRPVETAPLVSSFGTPQMVTAVVSEVYTFYTFGGLQYKSC